jgi:putative transposase
MLAQPKQPKLVTVALPEQIAPDSAKTLLALTDAQRAGVLSRCTIVQRFEAWRSDQGKGLKQLPAIGQFCARLRSELGADAPSARTLRRWLSKHGTGGIDGLVDRRGRPSATEAAGCSPDAWAYFCGEYLRENGLSIQLCWELTKRAAADNGWDWPSIYVVRKLANERLDKSTRAYHRGGRMKWMRDHSPHIVQDYTQWLVNQRWVGDHHVFDFLCTAGGKPIRAWLTGWQDSRSRKLVAWHIAESPNSDTILAAWRRGVEQYGAPTEVLIDNGKDYRAEGVAGGKKFKAGIDPKNEGALIACGVQKVHFSLKCRPGGKSIERCFGTVCKRFSKLFPTYVGHKPEARPENIYADLRAQNVEVPTIEEVRELFGQWVEEVYHNRGHRGDGMDLRSPNEVWAQEQKIVKRTVESRLLPLLLMRTAIAKVTRSGVTYNGVCYGMWNPELIQLRGRTVKLRIDPLDASYVYVCGLDGQILFRAENDAIRGATPEDVRKGNNLKRAAEKLVKRAKPAFADAQRSVTAHARILAQARLHKEQAKQRAAAGAENVEAPRGLGLIPGAAALAASLDKARRRSEPPAPQLSVDLSTFTGKTAQANAPEPAELGVDLESFTGAPPAREEGGQSVTDLHPMDALLRLKAPRGGNA